MAGSRYSAGQKAKQRVNLIRRQAAEPTQERTTDKVEENYQSVDLPKIQSAEKPHERFLKLVEGYGAIFSAAVAVGLGVHAYNQLDADVSQLKVVTEKNIANIDKVEDELKTVEQKVLSNEKDIYYSQETINSLYNDHDKLDDKVSEISERQVALKTKLK